MTFTFFMKDWIVTENIDIQYCPMEQMIADFLTKPLQGSLFEHFKRVIMGLDHISTFWKSKLVPTEECVEKGLLPTMKRPGSNQDGRPNMSFRNDSQAVFSSMV